MACIESRKLEKGKSYRIRLSECEDPKRPRLNFGKITRREAESVKGFVESLIASKNTGAQIQPAVQQWLAGLPDSIRGQLVALGLAEPVERKPDVSLRSWMDSYIESRTDVKPNTERNMKAARDTLFRFFDSNMNLCDFTAFDAEQFRVKCLEKNLAEATIRRRCKRLKQFFAAAVKKRLIADNPFDGIPVGSIAADKQFIGRDTIQKVIDHCPDIHWKLIFALARFGGLRIPSELV